LGPANNFGYVHRAVEDNVFDEVYDASHSNITPLLVNSEAHESFWSVMTMVALKRTLYLTDTGHVGLALGDVREGDILAGLFGIEPPFILREDGRGHYTMVNVAYVVGHELVLGERKEIASPIDSNTSKQQTFAIV
jgi:hypothetical protein